MRICDEKPCDEIFVARRHARAAFAAAPLRAVGREWHALDIAAMADGDDHILFLDEVLVFHLALDVEDLGAARRGELFLDGDKLVANDGHDAGAGTQNIQIVADFGGKALEFVADFVPAERCQALQAQVEDGFGLIAR